jgi:hypothetical protein
MVEEANMAASTETQYRGRQRWGDPSSYGSHSMRRGGVTEARKNGASMVDIQRHGRWKSLTVFNYIGQSEADRLAVTKSFFQQEMPQVMEAAAKGAAATQAGGQVNGTAADELPSEQATLLKKAEVVSKVTPAKRKGRDSEDEEEPSEREKEEELELEMLIDEANNQGYGLAGPSPDKKKGKSAKKKKNGNRKKLKVQ